MPQTVSGRTMHIGELAERTQLSLRTIRHYDEVGLLPASARTEGGFRLYSEGDYERLMHIRRMKPLGFSLEEMSELLDLLAAREAAGDGGGPELRGRLGFFLDQARERREKLARNLAQAEDLIAVLVRSVTP